MKRGGQNPGNILKVVLTEFGPGIRWTINERSPG